MPMLKDKGTENAQQPLAPKAQEIKDGFTAPSTPHLYQEIKKTGHISTDLSNKISQWTRAKVIELVELAIKDAQSQPEHVQVQGGGFAPNLSKAMAENAVVVLAKEFPDVIVSARTSSKQFDMLCKEYGKSHPSFTEAYYEKILPSGPGPRTGYNAGEGSTSVRVEMPRKERMETPIPEPESITIGSPRAADQDYAMLTEQGKKLYQSYYGKKAKVEPQALDEFASKVFDFFVGFQEIKEQKELAKKMREDPTLENMAELASTEKMMPYMLTLSAMGFIPFGKVGKVARGLDDVAEILLKEAKANRQFGSFVVGIGRKVEDLSSITELRSTVSKTDVLNFITMDPVERRQLAGRIIKNSSKSGEYQQSYEALSKMLREANISPPHQVPTEPIARVARSSTVRISNTAPIAETFSEGFASSWVKSPVENLSDLWKHVLNRPDDPQEFGKTIISFGARFKGNEIGQKVHILIPSFNEKEHYQMAATVIDELRRVCNIVGDGMSGKFMTSESGYKLGAGASKSQYGKDFTLYFANNESYEKALPYLQEIGEGLAKKEPDIKKVMQFANQNFGVNKFNMAHELPVGPYVTTSVRSHFGRTMLVDEKSLQELAKKMGLEQVLSNAQPVDGLYVITDDFLRNSTNRQLNQLLDEAYRQNLIGLI